MPGRQSSLDPRTLSILGKVILTELREVSKRMSDFVANPNYVKASKSFSGILQICNLIGFSGVRSYLTAMVQLAELIEASADNVPRSLTSSRAKILHAAIRVFGEFAKKIMSGHMGDYSEFDATLASMCVELKDICTPKLFAPVFASGEINSSWSKKNNKDTNVLFTAMRNLSEQFYLVANGQSCEADLIKESIAHCIAHNQHRELQQFFELIEPFQKGYTESVSPDVLLKFSKSFTSLSERVGASKNNVLLNAEEMSSALEVLHGLITATRNGKIPGVQSQQLISSLAVTYWMEKSLTGNVKSHEKYKDVAPKLEALWSRESSTGSARIVAKNLTSLAKGMDELNNPVYSKLLEAILEKSKQGDAGELYEFWINGAMSILLMNTTVAHPQLAFNQLEQTLADILVSRLKSNAPLIENMPPSLSMRAKSTMDAMMSIFAIITSSMEKAERAVESVIQKRAALGSSADPLKTAEVVGAQMHEILHPMIGILVLLRMPLAAKAVQITVEDAKNPDTWTYDDDAVRLYTRIAELSIFASRTRPGTPCDMDSENDRIAASELHLPPLSIGDVEESGPENQESFDETENAPVIVATEANGDGKLTYLATLLKTPAPEESQSAAQFSTSLLFMDVPENPEWLSVFLGESDELISQASHILNAYTKNDGVMPGEDFVILRRVFHTLKGSGLTVGLIQLSQAAQSAQRAFDAWFLASRVTLPDTVNAEKLMTMAKRGVSLFSSWTEMLKDNGFIADSMDNLASFEAEAIAVANLAPSTLDDNAENSQLFIEDTSKDIGFHGGIEISEADQNDFDLDEENNPQSGDSSEEPVMTAAELQVSLEAAYGLKKDVIDYGDTIIPVLLEEAETLLFVVSRAMDNLGSPNAVQKDIVELMGAVHGLKGSLRTAGAMRAGAILHALEDDLEHLSAQFMNVERLPCYQYAFDLVTKEISDIDISRRGFKIQRLTEIPISLTLAEPVAGLVTLQVDTPPTRAVETFLVESVPDQTSAMLSKLPSKSGQGVTVTADILTGISQKSGESVVLQGRATEELGVTWKLMKELSASVDRLQAQIRDLTLQAQLGVDTAGRSAGTDVFDSLEMDQYTSLQEVARLITENIEDVKNAQVALSMSLANLTETEGRKESLSNELQKQTSKSMVVAISSRVKKLQSVVRLAAKETNKSVELVIEGDAEVSSGVMSKLTVAIEHIVRNSIAHGIEAAEIRHQSKKPLIGKILMRISSDVEKTTITIQDDGAGINTVKVLEKAREKGLASYQKNYTNQEIYDLLFLRGLSTAESVSELAGRGVGLDAVKRVIQEFGGEVIIRSVEGKGSEFKIEAPNDVTSLSTIPVCAQGYHCLVPASLIERIVQVPTSIAEVAIKKGFINLDGKEFRYIRMGWLFCEISEKNKKPYAQLILCGNASGAPTVFEVDSLSQGKKVLVRPLGRAISGISGYIAGTTQADGTVSLIINPLRMRILGKEADQEQPKVAVPIAMVVDDSPTVRLYTVDFLRRQGYETMEASDGLDALEILKGITPDIILLDVEMPRMGGFDLLKAIRKSASTRLAQVPVIMISSRTAPKHQQHAFSLGATGYIGKPFAEDELVKLINKELCSLPNSVARMPY